MPTPDIPAAAIEAANAASRYTLGLRIASDIVEAVLFELLPGLYVTREPNGDANILAENPDVPTRPTALLHRTDNDARLFDAIAALLPDRTDEAPEDVDPLADVYVPCDACESSGRNCARHRTAGQVIAEASAQRARGKREG